MALAKDVNSYATVEEADIYFGDRLNASAWTASDSTVKAQALVTATMLLEDVQWIGTAVSELQPLAFPRNGEYFEPRIGLTIQLPAVVPPRIITALYELALHLIENEDALQSSGRTESIKVDIISIENSVKPPMFPRMVKNLISPLQVNRGSSLLWRAN